MFSFFSHDHGKKKRKKRIMTENGILLPFFDRKHLNMRVEL